MAEKKVAVHDARSMNKKNFISKLNLTRREAARDRLVSMGPLLHPKIPLYGPQNFKIKSRGPKTL